MKLHDEYQSLKRLRTENWLQEEDGQEAAWNDSITSDMEELLSSAPKDIAQMIRLNQL